MNLINPYIIFSVDTKRPEYQNFFVRSNVEDRMKEEGVSFDDGISYCNGHREVVYRIPAHNLGFVQVNCKVYDQHSYLTVDANRNVELYSIEGKRLQSLGLLTTGYSDNYLMFNGTNFTYPNPISFSESIKQCV